MGKMTMCLLLVFAIEMGLLMFMAQSPSPSSIYSYLINQSDTTGNGFYNLLLGKIGTIATLSAIIVGFFFIIRTEVAYAGVVIVIIAFVMDITRLWMVINSQGSFGDAAPYIATIITAPLMVFYMITTFDYIRRPD